MKKNSYTIVLILSLVMIMAILQFTKIKIEIDKIELAEFKLEELDLNLSK